jgi:hypothetical protein
MKFLIAGLGSIGRRHFRNLIALGEKDIIHLLGLREREPDQVVHEPRPLLVREIHLHRHLGRVLADQSLEQLAMLVKAGRGQGDRHRVRP